MRLRLSIVGTFITAIVILYSLFISTENKWDDIDSAVPISSLQLLLTTTSETDSPPSRSSQGDPSHRPDEYQSVCPMPYKQNRDMPDLSGIFQRPQHRRSPSRS